MRGQDHGFTLVEMLVAVAVLAIMAGMVIPNFSRVVMQGNMSSASNDLVSLMHSGRMEAVRTRQQVVVCPSSNGVTCAGTNWKQAIMFVDRDRNQQVSSGESVRRIIQLPEQLVVTNQISGSAAVIFTPNGMAQFPQGMITNTAAVSICSPKVNNDVRVIHVGTSMGRTKSLQERRNCTQENA